AAIRQPAVQRLMALRLSGLRRFVGRIRQSRHPATGGTTPDGASLIRPTQVCGPDKAKPPSGNRRYNA
ncbi:MAG: hypothetical protein ACRCYL_03230, partial [Kluyvera sp.]